MPPTQSEEHSSQLPSLPFAVMEQNDFVFISQTKAKTLASTPRHAAAPAKTRRISVVRHNEPYVQFTDPTGRRAAAQQRVGKAGEAPGR